MLEQSAEAVVPTVGKGAPLPCSLRHVVPSESADGNGHLNMAQYLSLHDRALRLYFTELGMGPRYRDVERRGLFTVEQHLAYHAEGLVGTP
jgi:acyl-CoA thioesterase FadM